VDGGLQIPKPILFAGLSAMNGLGERKGSSPRKAKDVRHSFPSVIQNGIAADGVHELARAVRKRRRTNGPAF